MTTKENRKLILLAEIASKSVEIERFQYYSQLADVNGEPAVSEHYADKVRDLEDEIFHLKKELSFLEA